MASVNVLCGTIREQLAAGVSEEDMMEHFGGILVRIAHALSSPHDTFLSCIERHERALPEGALVRPATNCCLFR